MTLQLVDISPLGIVCAADSAMTPLDKQRGQESWPKLICIQRLKAVIGYYGYSLVGNRRMPDWLENFQRRSRADTLHEFSVEIRDALNLQWKTPPTRIGTGFHLAGYTVIDTQKLPSFHHIWNHKGLEGNYEITGNGFLATSDFLERDAKEFVPYNLDKYFEKIGGSRVYRNGALSPYYALAESLNEFRTKIWTDRLLEPLVSIDQWAWFYRFEFETVKLMYQYIFNQKRPPVGRRIDIFTINPSGKITKLPQKREAI